LDEPTINHFRRASPRETGPQFSLPYCDPQGRSSLSPRTFPAAGRKARASLFDEVHVKRTGKGQGISINGGGTSHINRYKMQMTGDEVTPPREFKPLVVKRRPEQDRIDAFNAIPSRFA